MILSPVNDGDSAPSFEPTDEELVAEVLAGATPSFARLLEKHRPMLWRVAYRMSLNREDALDICQTVAIRLWRVLPRFRPGGNFPAWLRTIAARETLRWLKRNRPASRMIDRDAFARQVLDPSGCAPEGPSRLVAQENRERLARAMTALAPKQRLAVNLRFFEELALREVAAAMGCSEGSVKRHLFRAVEKLRRALKEEK